MVTKFTRNGRRARCGGFAISEAMVSSGIFSALSLALLMGFTALERNYVASNDYALNHADEMRISDYLALDLRRAVSVQASQNDTTINIPNYYDDSGNPATPTLNGQGGVSYGAVGSTIQIHYFLNANKIYRQQGAAAAVPIALNVADFVFDVTDSGKVVTTRVTFKPIFKVSGASLAAIAGTAFHNTTLLRNNRTDVTSGVY